MEKERAEANDSSNNREIPPNERCEWLDGDNLLGRTFSEVSENTAGLEVKFEDPSSGTFEVSVEEQVLEVPQKGRRWESKFVRSTSVPKEAREKFGIKEAIDPDIGGYDVKVYPLLYEDLEEVQTEKVAVKVGKNFRQADIPELIASVGDSVGPEGQREVAKNAHMFAELARGMKNLEVDDKTEKGAVVAEVVGKLEAWSETMGSNTSEIILNEGEQEQIKRILLRLEELDEEVSDLQTREVLREEVKKFFETAMWRVVHASAENNLVERTGLSKEVAAHFNSTETFNGLAEYFPEGRETGLGSLEEAKATYKKEKEDVLAKTRILEEMKAEAESGEVPQEDLASAEQEYQKAVEVLSETQMKIARAINALMISPEIFRYQHGADNLESNVKERYVNCYTRQRLVHIFWEREFGEVLLHGSKGVSIHQFPVLKRADGKMISLDIAVEELEVDIVADPSMAQHSKKYKGVNEPSEDLRNIGTPIVIGENVEMTIFAKYAWEASESAKKAGASSEEEKAELLGKAKVLYEKALSICPNHPKYLNDHAEVLLMLGDVEGATKIFEQLDKADPDNPQWSSLKLGLLENTGATEEEVLAYFESKIRPGAEGVAWRRARIGYLLARGVEGGNSTRLEKEYTELISLEDTARHRNEFGKFLLSAGKTEEAKEQFFIVCGEDLVNPNNAFAWAEYMKILEQEDPNEALNIYERAAEKEREKMAGEKGKSEAVARKYYGRFLRIRGGDESLPPTEQIEATQMALEVFKEMFESDPTYVALPDVISKCYEMLADQSSLKADKRKNLEMALAYEKSALKIILEFPYMEPAVKEAVVRERIRYLKEEIENEPMERVDDDALSLGPSGEAEAVDSVMPDSYEKMRTEKEFIPADPGDEALGTTPAQSQGPVDL